MQVEDRRLQTEKELISYKVKYEVAEKAYSVAREHLKKMKVCNIFLLIMNKS